MYRCRKNASDFVQGAQKKEMVDGAVKRRCKRVVKDFGVNHIYLLENMQKKRTKSDEFLRVAKRNGVLLLETP